MIYLLRRKQNIFKNRIIYKINILIFKYIHNNIGTRVLQRRIKLIENAIVFSFDLADRQWYGGINIIRSKEYFSINHYLLSQYRVFFFFFFVAQVDIHYTCSLQYDFESCPCSLRRRRRLSFGTIGTDIIIILLHKSDFGQFLLFCF